MTELADLIIKQTGSSSPITRQPLPKDDPKQRQPNITLAKEHLGWSPKVSLQEGLKPTIAYFHSLLSGLGIKSRSNTLVEG
jgi:UDP-glucuronate decarboxylase